MSLQIQSMMKSVQSNVVALPQGTTGNIFTITGDVWLLLILGRCTTVIGSVANATKLQYVDTVTSTAYDMCATSDVNALAAGAFYTAVTSVATAASISNVNGRFPYPWATATAVPLSWIFSDGVIRVNCAGSDGGTGRMRWSACYLPLSSGSQIASA